MFLKHVLNFKKYILRPEGEKVVQTWNLLK